MEESYRIAATTTAVDVENEKWAFAETMKQLLELTNGFRCVQCKVIPSTKVYMLGRCLHKYCDNCIWTCVETPCVICGKTAPEEEAKPDLFSTGIIQELLRILDAISEVKDQLLDQSGVSNVSNGKPAPKENPMLNNQSSLPSSVIEVTDADAIRLGPETKPVSQTLRNPQAYLEEIYQLDSEFGDHTPTPKRHPAASSSPEVFVETPQNKSNSFLNRLPPPRSEKRVRRSLIQPEVEKVKESVSVTSEDEESNVPRRKKMTTEDNPAETGSGSQTDDRVEEQEPLAHYSDEELFSSYDPEAKGCQVLVNEHNEVPILTPYGAPAIKDDATDVEANPCDPPQATGASTGRNMTKGKQNIQIDSNKRRSTRATRKNQKARESDEHDPPLLTPHPNEKSGPELVLESKNTPKQIKGNKSTTPLTEVKKSVSKAKRQRRQSTSSVLSTGSSLNTSFIGKETHKRNAKGETPLHIACRTGKVEKVQNLIANGGDVDATDNAGWTPLHDTVSGKGSAADKTAIVRILCENGCNVNAVGGTDDDTPLHDAAQCGLEEVAEILLSYGASPNIRNAAGRLPKDVTFNEILVKMLSEKSILQTSLNASVSEMEDPAALEANLKKAFVYFAFEAPHKLPQSTKDVLKLRVLDKLSATVTHIIYKYELPKEDFDAKMIPLNFDYLYGLACGMWQLSHEWISKSLENAGCLVPTEYEIKGCSSNKELCSSISTKNIFTELRGIPEIARINRENGKPGLFHGISFYLYKTCCFGKLAKKDLTQLINGAGGKIINREPNPDTIDPLESPERFHACVSNHAFTLTSHVVLYHDKARPPQKKMFRLEHVKTLKSDWVIDCIGNFQLVDPDDYY